MWYDSPSRYSQCRYDSESRATIVLKYTLDSARSRTDPLVVNVLKIRVLDSINLRRSVYTLARQKSSVSCSFFFCLTDVADRKRPSVSGENKLSQTRVGFVLEVRVGLDQFQRVFSRANQYFFVPD